MAAVLTCVVAMATAAEPDVAGVVQTAVLDPGHPFFVPTHVRVSTTIRFPKPIGAPDGSVSIFTEDAAKHAAEYLVTWQPGDAYLTVTPLKDAQLANLNVPYEGETYVFYFFPVQDPLKAVASVNLSPKTGVAPEPAAPATSAPVRPVVRTTTQPVATPTAVTPARLMGFIDRLKLIDATVDAAALNNLVGAMQVEAATPGASARDAGERAPTGRREAVVDAGLFQIALLRAVRDPRLGCVGFICRVRNTTDQVLAFDPNSFAARVGGVVLPQRISEAPAILKPAEQRPAYFVVQPAPESPLRAANDWRISVELVSPRLNPGAVIARTFGKGGEKP